MPSSLTSTKIKDTYGQVLHVDGGVTSTPKVVYDGDGTATALKVSTTDVQVNNSPVLTDADIGSTVQAYDADLTAWSGKTAPSGTVVGTTDTQTLTNKTISGANNTLSNIGNASLSNSSVTVGSTNIALGATSTTLAGLTSVTSSSFVGPLTGNAETVTNGVYTTGDQTIGGTKTFSSNPVLNGGTANGVAYLNGSKVLTTGSALTFDGSNLGLGVTPSAWGGGFVANQVKGASMWTDGNTRSFWSTNLYFDGSNRRYISSNPAFEYSQTSTGHTWLTAPSGTAGNAISFTQAMTLDASGNLLVGTTDAYGGNSRLRITGPATASQQQISCHNPSTSGTRLFITFGTEATYTERGWIQWNGTTMALTNASDSRLKENIVDAPSGLSKIAAIQIRSFDFKEDGRHVDYGVVAQELKEILPAAVFEGSDNKDGTINKPWSVGLEPVIPVLVKAIQELKAELDATKAEVAALKAIN